MDIEDYFKQESVRCFLMKFSENPTPKQFEKLQIEYRRKYKGKLINKEILLKAYTKEVEYNPILRNIQLENFLKVKKNRSLSGVLIITIVCSPYPEHGFSCQYNCYYCPSYPDMPKSYMGKTRISDQKYSGEPAVMRAEEVKFDIYDQFRYRATHYQRMEHKVDKVELIIIGGTWSSHREYYQKHVITQSFYAANTLCDKTHRNCLSMEEEIKINETSKCHIIGVTVETRPDMITPQELTRYRQMGITRVQLGIQHTNDRILYRVNRGCSSQNSINAIKLLKNFGFKVDIHIMPDLPKPLKEGRSNVNYDKDDIDENFDMVQADRLMFNTILDDPNYQIDQLKIYPTQITPYTRIKEDYERGLYKPYSSFNTFQEFEQNPLFKLLYNFKSHIHPWIRINRLVRDIPIDIVIQGVKISNARNYIEIRLKRDGKSCNCIRCREPKNNKLMNYNIIVRQYIASEGTEWFISAEMNNIRYGFLRLRISKENGKYKNKVYLQELVNTAIIRELHVYGGMATIGTKGIVQHHGIGKALMAKAETISKKHNIYKMAVISGEGVKGYYRKLGYVDDGLYLTKKLKKNTMIHVLYILCILFILIAIIKKLMN